MGRLWEGIFRCPLMLGQSYLSGKKCPVLQLGASHVTLPGHSFVTTFPALIYPSVNAKVHSARAY